MFITKCPYCKELIREGAIRCKHCHANLEGNGDVPTQQSNERIQYLKNGFKKIDSECETIEEKMKLRTGFVFVKHLYSSDELFYAISRIEAFVEEMKDELDELEAETNASQRISFLFSKKAEETYHRLESLHLLIEQREPTWWEKVKGIVKRIIDKLLSIFPLEMIARKAMETVMAAA